MIILFVIFKGFIVWIYDFCVLGMMFLFKMIFVIEWVGVVILVMYMFLYYDIIFFGYEGGFVSVWDGKELVCK